jgi:hypothetical protein
VHDVVEGRADWKELAGRAELIGRAEQGYRSDPELSRNLEAVGWTTERREAALRGEAILLDPDTVHHHGPVLDLDRIAGRPVTQPTVTAWAEFHGLHAQVDADRTELLARIHPEIARQAAEREAEILDAAPDRPLRDLDTAASELTSLVKTLAATRTAAGILARHGSLRERITSLDVFLAARAKAAGDDGYTLLGPVEQPRRTLATGSAGLRQDEPRTASSSPPAGVIMRG